MWWWLGGEVLGVWRGGWWVVGGGGCSVVGASLTRGGGGYVPQKIRCIHLTDNIVPQVFHPFLRSGACLFWRSGGELSGTVTLSRTQAPAARRSTCAVLHCYPAFPHCSSIP